MKPKKQCSVENCQWPLYARGYCLSHYKVLYLLPRQKKNKLSDKKTKLNKEYKDKRLEFIEAERNKHPLKKIFCIFCGKEIEGDPSLHHALGRDDDIMLDEKYWFLSHNFCHVHQYHSMSWSKIPWWKDYILRILSTGIHEIIVLESKRMEK